jgi:transposase
MRRALEQAKAGLLATFGERFRSFQHASYDLYCREMKLPIALLPKSSSLHLETWHVDEATAQLTLCLTSPQPWGYCPRCRYPTRRIHSRYERTVADLPWAHLRVRLHLRVRKFFCTRSGCSRRIFTERLPQVVAPWARRTQRLVRTLGHLAVALGGAAGARLSQQLGMKTSRNTLLRLLRRLPLPSLRTPTVLGVDDFALRKRQTYGTALIDLERHRPVALLPDRTAETLAHWLQQHPGVQVITRDRAKAYAEGARQGAPAALQVTDRFHLVQNLAEALDQVFTMHGKCLDAVNATLRQRSVPLPVEATAMPVALPDPSPGLHQRAAQRQARRQLLHEQVWTLHCQGWTLAAIAQHVGLSPRTVQRDLRTATFAGRKRRSDYGQSLLDPYKALLLQQWNAGCHTALRLFRALRSEGYAGSYTLVAAYVRGLRQIQGLAPGHRRPQQPLPSVAEPPGPSLTARRATRLVLRRADKRTAHEVQQLSLLRAQQTELTEVIDLAQDFAQLVRLRWPAQFDAWLERAATSTASPFQRFAKGLREDYAAIKAGITLLWSNGPVEGQINRLKMLKRQMFGRARLDLLSRRFVLAPRRRLRRTSYLKPSGTPAELLAA